MDSLIIADGTPYATTVLDVRADRQWAQCEGDRAAGAPAAIYLHHTADSQSARWQLGQLDIMNRAADADEWGLPYNFVIWPGAEPNIYYLNDVDQCWPHTYGHNCDCAIAAWGNFEVNQGARLVALRMRRLVRALRLMWGEEVPTYGHREVFATACPGQYLWRQLQALGLTGGN